MSRIEIRCLIRTTATQHLCPAIMVSRLNEKSKCLEMPSAIADKPPTHMSAARERECSLCLLFCQLRIAHQYLAHRRFRLIKTALDKTIRTYVYVLFCHDQALRPRRPSQRAGSWGRTTPRPRRSHSPLHRTTSNWRLLSRFPCSESTPEPHLPPLSDR